MMFRTHLAFGLLISFLLFNLLTISIIFLPISLIASVFPDIDEPRSRIGRKFGVFSKITSFIFKHRGIMHSIYIPILIYFVFHIINQKTIGLVFIIGYLSHLVIDGFTLAGVNFLHPLSSLRIKGFIETNSFKESLLFILLLIGNTYIILNYIL